MLRSGVVQVLVCSSALALAMGFAPRVAGAQAVLQVPGDAPGIQAAIDMARSGDTVVVAPGRWTGLVHVAGKALTLLGAGGADLTSIDAGRAGTAVRIDGGSDVLVVGFTITGGLASQGGGLYTRNSTVVIEECRIVGNEATLRGGGLAIDDTHEGGYSAVLRSCDVSHNTSAGRGGGLYAVSFGQLVLEGCRLRGNSAATDGGGIAAFNVRQGLVMNDCLLLRNTSGRDGGGMNVWDSQLQMTRCDLDGNRAAENGGGLSYFNLLGAGLTPTLTGCRALRNRAGGAGGGLHLVNQGEDIIAGASIKLLRCRISDNAGQTAGGLFGYTEYSGILVRDCLVSGNRASLSGGGLYLTTGNSPVASGIDVTCSTIVHNEAPLGAGVSGADIWGSPLGNLIDHCIVWGNRGGQLAGVADAQWCDVEGGHPGLANLDLDPLFLDPAAGDYHVAPGSPCRDAGDPAFVPLPGELDIDGEPRVQGGRVDIGADELPP